MKLSENRFVIRRKARPAPMPPTGPGVHQWEYAFACWARDHGLDPQQAVNGILAYDGTLHRRLQPRAVQTTVEKAYATTVEFDPLKSPPPPRVEWNRKETARIHGDFPATTECLINASPQDVRGLCTRDILSQLFPNSDGLLCIGRGPYYFHTGPLRGFPNLGSWEFIVPSYMTTQMGKTAAGKLSYHSKANTGPRRFIVFDFDEPPPEEHASIIMHLGKFRPITMVLSSGGKSLHAWFPTTDRVNDDELFWRVGITLGADPTIQRNPSQFVRLPLGIRSAGKHKGNRQRVLYFNPDSIPQ